MPRCSTAFRKQSLSVPFHIATLFFRKQLFWTVPISALCCAESSAEWNLLKSNSFVKKRQTLKPLSHTQTSNNESFVSWPSSSATTARTRRWREKENRRKEVDVVTWFRWMLAAFAPLNSNTLASRILSHHLPMIKVMCSPKKHIEARIEVEKKFVFNERNFWILFRSRAHATLKHLDSILFPTTRKQNSRKEVANNISFGSGAENLARTFTCCL